MVSNNRMHNTWKPIHSIQPNISYKFSKDDSYRIRGDIEEAGSTAATIEVASAQEVFLRVASNLSWGSSLNKIPRDSSPVSFPHFLQSLQEKFVLFLRPRYSWESSTNRHPQN